MSNKLICERCGIITTALVVSIAHEAVCPGCIHFLEKPEIKLRVSDNLETRNISKIKEYLARHRGKG